MEGTKYISINPGMSSAPMTPAFLPLQARLEQLEAAIRGALDKTNGATYYPQEDTLEGGGDPVRNEGMIATVDILNDMMFRLNARFDRIREVTGGVI